MECCRWSFDPGRADAVRTLAVRVDWDRFQTTIERHRVSGLAWNSIHSLGLDVPAAVRSALSDRANFIVAQGLQAAAESAALSKALDAASIPHLFIKGLVVGALAYGSPFFKQSWDVDLLVGEDRIQQGAELLQRLGYELIFPKIAVGRLSRWHESQKDSAWRHSTTGVIVELHSRLADNHRLIPTVGLGSRRQMVTVAKEVALPTLADEEMFAHLCVHGASSGWFRLKWISDLAALLFRWQGQTERLFRRSQQFGTGRSAGQALLLANRLFETEIGPELIQSLESEPSIQWLADIAMKQLQASEPGDQSFGTGMIHLSQLMLLPGLGFKASEARRQIVAATSNLFN